MRPLVSVLITLLLCLSVAAQTDLSTDPFPDAPSALISNAEFRPAVFASGSVGVEDAFVPESVPDIDQLQSPTLTLPPFLIAPVVAPPPRTRFDWENASKESFAFLSVQHGLRLLQPKTRNELGGAFWPDYAASIKGIQGWGDGDGPWTNYILHPGEGGIASWIFIHNSPSARRLEFDSGNPHYWNSRLRAMAFAAAYSTQFEIGLYSEATIGNVGKAPGTSGWVDFVMTPVGGFAFTVAEDAVDRHIIQKLEANPTSANRKRLYRVLLNPERSIANLLRLRAPWHRDTRPEPQD